MKKVFTNIAPTAAIALPYLALAQYQVPSQLTQVADRLANTAVGIIIAISVFYILWGAVQYMTQSGGEKGASAGRNTILYAVVAIIVALLARVLVNIVVQAVSQVSGTSGPVF